MLAWGNNGEGLLGIGRVSDGFERPTRIATLQDVVAIGTSSGVTAAVTRDGRVWTWGSNTQGGLGNGVVGDTIDAARVTPQPVAGITDAVDVEAGSYGRHCSVRRRNGTLIGWGNTDWGQLGAGLSGQHQPKPTRPSRLPTSRTTGSAATSH